MGETLPWSLNVLCSGVGLQQSYSLPQLQPHYFNAPLHYIRVKGPRKSWSVHAIQLPPPTFFPMCVALGFSPVFSCSRKHMTSQFYAGSLPGAPLPHSTVGSLLRCPCPSSQWLFRALPPRWSWQVDGPGAMQIQTSQGGPRHPQNSTTGKSCVVLAWVQATRTHTCFWNECGKYGRCGEQFISFLDRTLDLYLLSDSAISWVFLDIDPREMQTHVSTETWA